MSFSFLPLPRDRASRLPGFLLNALLLWPGSPAIVLGAAVEVVAPAIRQVVPPPGTVGELPFVTVVFTGPVTGVGFSDLLFNQRPATGLTGAGDTYTFTLEQPGYGEVRVTWDPGAGITAVGEPAVRFDVTAPSSEWSYRLIDATPPLAIDITPAPGNAIRALNQIEVRFSEPVTGVDALDLLVGGRLAASVTGLGAGPYVFQCGGVNPGADSVVVEWVEDHGIGDLATPANRFAGGSWRYAMDAGILRQPVRINEILTGYGGDTGLRDEDGDLQDWIELQNRGTGEANLGGWSLTDDPAVPGKWVFPEVRIAPGGFLLVFASARDRRTVGPGGRLHANFKLGAGGGYLGLFDGESPRGIVSEFAPSYPVQRSDVSYGFDSGDLPRHFQVPTPGAANGLSTITGVLPAVDFNVGRGVFERPFELHLSSAVPGAQIQYATDGNEPSATTGTLYSGPLAVTGTAIFRAASFKPGYLPSASVTHTYVFPAQVARQPANPPGVPDRWIDTTGRSWTADYEMDPEIVNSPTYRDRVLPALKALPVLSIVARPADMFDNRTGIYPRSQGRGPSWERPASAEFIDWERGTTAQATCGVQMQGNSVRDPVKTGKHAFRLVFKGDYGPATLKYRVFPDLPLDEFDTLTIRADFNNSWMHWNGSQRPRGMRVRDAWMKESQRAMGGLASHSRFFHLYVNGLYWGVYDAVERPDSAFAAAHLGGAKEDFDVVNEGTIVDGNMAAYNTMRGLTGVETQAGYERMKQYLDVPAYIDYLLLHFYVGHEDWFTDKNWYASRRRVPGAGFRYQAWDGESILNSPSQNIVTRTDQPSGLHTKMLPNPQYRLDFADRVQRHLLHGGALTPAAAAGRFDRWAAGIEPAMVAECARWGDYRRDVHQYSGGPYELYTPDVHFKAEWQRLRTQYFPGRTATVLSQLKAAGLYPVNAVAPTFNTSGGSVVSGFQLAIAAPAGTIWFTTDGGDPRLAHAGAVSANARTFDGPLVLEATTVVKARTLLGTEWSALSEVQVDIGSGGVALAITEIHYHPADGDPYEFVELTNYGRVPVDATGFYFEGISYLFPPEAVIGPGQTIVIASELSPRSFAARHPDVPVFGWSGGTLSDGGERLVLRDRQGHLLSVVNYDDEKGWPRGADGRGASLELLDPRGDPDAPANWRASLVPEGTPGVPTTVVTGPPVVRLSEVSPTPKDGPGDWIEVHNAGGSRVDLGGWSLTDDSDPRRFVFRAGTVLSADGYLVVHCRASPGVMPAGLLEADFALASEGETITLHDAATNRVDALTYGVLPAGSTVGRSEPDARWVLCMASPGAPNLGQVLAAPTAVSLNEWLANPVPGGGVWVELHNRDTTRPAALQGFRLATSDGTARLGALSFIVPGGFLVLRADEKPGADPVGLTIPATAGFLEWYDPTGVRLERVEYAAQDPGISRGRIPDGGPNVESFPASMSPGASNHRAVYAGPLLNEVQAWNIAPLPGSPADGVMAGWVELFNPSASVADLAGMRFGVEPDPKRAWVFPAGFLVPPHGYVVLPCDAGRSLAADAARRPNTGLAIRPPGGGVYLFDPSGFVVDSIEFGFQPRGLSIGRTGQDWRLLEMPTPEAPNAISAVLGADDAVRINELLASSSVSEDWIELHNAGNWPVDLSRLHLADHPGLAGVAAWSFPPLSFIGPRDFVKIEADGRQTAGPEHTGFQLSAGGEALILADVSGRVVDEVYFGRQVPGISLGRLPDGDAGGLQPLPRTTPGRGNATVAYTPPTITAARWVDGGLTMRVEGDLGPEYRVEGTTDLAAWVEVASVRPVATPFDVRLTGAADSSMRFFRVVLRP